MNQVSPNSGVILADKRASPEVALSEEDREALKRAVEALEAPSFAARLSAVAGRPIELLGQALPQAVSETASRATQVALTRAMRYALKTDLRSQSPGVVPPRLLRVTRLPERTSCLERSHHARERRGWAHTGQRAQ